LESCLPRRKRTAQTLRTRQSLTRIVLPQHFHPFRLPEMKLWLPSLCLLLGFAVCASAADWPQFRGPHSAGIATPETVLPADIGPEKHVLWKTELPPGHSSPAIVGDKIFLTAVRDKDHLETICLDRAKGRILWRVEAPHQTLEQIHGIGSYAQPSPA